MSEELRLCPFCGCKAQAVTEPFDPDDLDFMNFDDIDDPDCFDITCSNVRCVNGWWLTPEQWNTRPIEDALNDRIAALEAEVAALKEDADIVKHCGFEIITEPETGKYPARKVLRGRDHIHVPVFPEVQQ